VNQPTAKMPGECALKEFVVDRRSWAKKRIHTKERTTTPRPVEARFLDRIEKKKLSKGPTRSCDRSADGEGGGEEQFEVLALPHQSHGG